MANRANYAAQVEKHGIPVHLDYAIWEAVPNSAKDGVSAVRLQSLSPTTEAQLDRRAPIECDGVVMSVGWAPALNLLYQAGTKMRYSTHVEQFVPEQLPPGVFAAGRVNGVYTLTSKLKDGERAGLEAARYLGLGTAIAPVPVPAEVAPPSHPYPIVDHPKGKNFVDFDEDIQVKDFVNAAQEGFDNIELMKRYTTVGMGPSQGKHSNMNAIRILAKILGKPIQEVGTTTARPFFHPVPLSHLAGRSFYPERITPLHSRHAALNAKFMQAGVWLRPEYYQFDGKTKDDAVREEVRAVRQRSGTHRCRHPRQTRGLRRRCGGIPGAHLHRPLRQYESRHDALRPHVRRIRRDDRRRCGSAFSRATFLFHYHDHRLRYGLPRTYAAQHTVALECRHRQRYGSLRRGESRRPALPCGVADPNGFRYRRRRIPLSRRSRGKRVRHTRAVHAGGIRRRVGLRNSCAGRIRCGAVGSPHG